MRATDELEHTECLDVLQEVQNCYIFNIHQGDDEMHDDSDPESYRTDEFALCNDACIDKPLILTRAELKKLGEQIIELSEKL